MRVAIIGRGHVGHTMIGQFEGRAEVISYDLTDPGPYPASEISTCDLALISVNTPSLSNGAVDLTNVKAALRELPCDRVIIRSTVPPGTTAALSATTGKSICFWPEYVGETKFSGSPWENFAASEPFIILGGEREARTRAIDLLLPIVGPEVRFYQCSSDEAELVKYMENSYFAAKTVFVNEFRTLSEALGLDWHAVREGWLLDPRIERDHSASFAENRGFGGKCLPKDLAGILQFAGEIGVSLPMISAIQTSNETFRAGID